MSPRWQTWKTQNAPAELMAQLAPEAPDGPAHLQVRSPEATVNEDIRVSIA